MNEDHDSSGNSVDWILPPITKPVNRRRFGSLFPNAVAQALAGAADGMTSAFSKVRLLLYSPKVQLQTIK